MRYVGLREVDDSQCSSICSTERRASELRGQALNLEQPPRGEPNLTKASRVISLHRAVDGTWKHRLDEQQRRACELITLYKKSVAPTKDEDQFLVRTGLATRADFIEALACESDSSCVADLKLWLDRLEPHWRNQPKMTFVEAQALRETDQRCSEQDWSIQTATRNGSLAHSRRRLWKWRWLAQLAPRSVLCRYHHVASQAGMCEAMTGDRPQAMRDDRRVNGA